MNSSIIGITGALLFSYASLLPAQLRESSTSTRTSSVLVVRTSGSSSGARTSSISSVDVPRLSSTDVSTMLNPLGYSVSTVAGPWTVSMHQRVTAGGRITLDFFGVSVLMGRSQEPLVDGKGEAQIVIRASAPGESYLLDCAVYRMLGGGGYRLIAPGDKETTTTSNHILAIYDAPDTQGAAFRIQSTSEYMPFNFESCTISRVTK